MGGNYLTEFAMKDAVLEPKTLKLFQKFVYPQCPVQIVCYVVLVTNFSLHVKNKDKILSIGWLINIYTVTWP